MDNTEQDRTEEQPGASLEQADRRKWSRVSDGKRSRIWFSTPMGGARYAHAEDISLGGFSMIVTGSAVPEIGQKLVVGFDEWLIPARVKHVFSIDHSQHRVGMEWVRPESPAVTTLLQRRSET